MNTYINPLTLLTHVPLREDDLRFKVLAVAKAIYELYFSAHTRTHLDRNIGYESVNEQKLFRISVISDYV